MIQRIQSIYLLLALIALTVLFFFPIAELFVDGNMMSVFRYRGLFELKDGKEIMAIAAYPLAILLSINMLLGLITIFKFKNRKFQMRLCLINILLLLGSLVLIAYMLLVSFANLQAALHYKFASLMPIIAIIFSFLAYKGIQKDEKLIKSIDRIR